MQERQAAGKTGQVRWSGLVLEGLKFITQAYIQAALLDIRALLLMAEETTDDVRKAALTTPQQGLSVQLYYMLALLTKNRALDKLQGAGEGEGLAAWCGLREQWEPKSRSRFTSMLLGILNGRFKGDAQNDIESWESDIRSFEKQTSFEIPRFRESWHPHQRVAGRTSSQTHGVAYLEIGHLREVAVGGD